MMWFERRGDERLGRCATEGCGGQPTFRLEIAGIGSNYCSGCQCKITSRRFNNVKDMLEYLNDDEPSAVSGLARKRRET
jgi:hypothetical protein